MRRSEQRDEPIQYWGYVERMLIVWTLSVVAILQILVLGEVFTDAGAEFVAVVDAVYSIFGVFFAYLIMTIIGDLIEKILFWAGSDLTETQSEAIRTLVWGAASVFLFSNLREFEPATGEFADLAMTPYVFAVLFGVLLALRAVPSVVWERLYRSLSFLRGLERAQVTGTHMPVILGIVLTVALIVVNTMFTQLPPAGSGEVADLCMGVCGCGACPTWYYAGAAGLLGSILALGVALRHWRGESE